MNTMLYALVLIMLATVIPLAAADPDPLAPGTDASAAPLQPWCVDVNIHNTPPVDVYECPSTTGP